jgi:hypothetical protein
MQQIFVIKNLSIFFSKRYAIANPLLNVYNHCIKFELV